MKFARIGQPGKEVPALVDKDGAFRDLSSEVADLKDSALDPAELKRLAALDHSRLPALEKSARIGPPVARTGKFVCVGLNYAKHAAESGMPVPDQPVLFMKATSAIQGPNDDVVIPKGSEKTDWEVELGVVIGRKAQHVGEDDALACVAGYCVVNDLSERDFQLSHGGQWVKGKSCDTFGPIGPYLVTTDEIPDPQTLDLWLDVNGQRRQQSNTDDMVFSVRELVSHISRYMTLEPGDVISTGTPFGVGLGLNPPTYLSPGDVMHLGITGLGEQHQTTRAFEG